MAPLVYSLQFRGFTTRVARDVMEAKAVAPAGTLVTTIGDDGLDGRIEASDGVEAVLQSRLVLVDGRFDVIGRISVGRGSMLRFRSLGPGKLSATADPALRQGAVVCDIVGGEGQFAGASGRITSNVLLSDSGDLTDTQLGVVFLAHSNETEPQLKEGRT